MVFTYPTHELVPEGTTLSVDSIIGVGPPVLWRPAISLRSLWMFVAVATFSHNNSMSSNYSTCNYWFSCIHARTPSLSLHITTCLIWQVYLETRKNISTFFFVGAKNQSMSYYVCISTNAISTHVKATLSVSERAPHIGDLELKGGRFNFGADRHYSTWPCLQLILAVGKALWHITYIMYMIRMS